MKQKREKVKESDEDSNPGPIGPAPHPNSEKKTTENNIQLIIKNTLSAPPPPPPPRNPDEKVKIILQEYCTASQGRSAKQDVPWRILVLVELWADDVCLDGGDHVISHQHIVIIWSI